MSDFYQFVENMIIILPWQDTQWAQAIQVGDHKPSIRAQLSSSLIIDQHHCQVQVSHDGDVGDGDGNSVGDGDHYHIFGRIFSSRCCSSADHRRPKKNSLKDKENYCPPNLPSFTPTIVIILNAYSVPFLIFLHCHHNCQQHHQA